METSRMLSRRSFLAASAVAGATVLVACAPKAPAEPTAAAPAASSGGSPTSAPSSGAQPASKSPTNVVVMYGRAELSDADIALCMEKYPEIKIEYLERDDTRLMAMLAAGEPPDYIRNDAVDIAYWVRQKTFLDMTPYIDASAKIKWDDFHPVGEMYRHEGGFWGIMKDWGASYSVWCYLPVWEEAGVTLPDHDKPMDLSFYREAAAKLTKKEGDRVLIFGWDVAWDAGHIQKALGPLGKSLYSPEFDKVIIKDNPEATEFIKFITDWQKEKTCTSAINPSDKPAADGFCSKLSATVNTGYWLAANCVSKVPETEEQVMMFPAWGWGDVAQEYNPNAAGAGGSIARESKVADAAWIFNEFYTIEEPAIARAKTGWGVPAFKSLFPLMPQGTPWRKTLYDKIMKQAESVLPPLQFGPYMRRASMDAPFKKYSQMYLKDEISFDDMLVRLEDEVNQVINDAISRQG